MVKSGLVIPSLSSATTVPVIAPSSSMPLPSLPVTVVGLAGSLSSSSIKAAIPPPSSKPPKIHGQKLVLLPKTICSKPVMSLKYTAPLL